MWGGKKAREKYNLDYGDGDEFDDSESCSYADEKFYSENDIWHMCYGLSAFECDLTARITGVSVRGKDNYIDGVYGHYGSFDISINVGVSLGRLHNGEVTSDQVKYVVEKLIDKLGQKLNSKGDFGYEINVSNVETN